MKKLILFLLLSLPVVAVAQQNEPLKEHYEAYYKAMRARGDVRGVINALTHLNILQPTPERRDTLAYIYSNNNQHVQALNILGVEQDSMASDLSVQVKALSLKAINQPQRAKEQFLILYKRKPNPYLAYELADLMIQLGEDQGAMEFITYGLANASEKMKYAFYERQQPYQVPLQAAFLHLKGLVQYNTDKTDIDTAISTMDEALAMAPNFNLASLSRQALESRKEKKAGE